MTKILGPEQVARVFSIFHDGSIESRETNEHSDSVFVEIAYLAARTGPKHIGFVVDLHGLRSARFQAWPDGDLAYPAVAGLEIVLAFDLEILDGVAHREAVMVRCLSHSSDYRSQGGELTLDLSGIDVRDESGRAYSLADLEALCSDYWKAWSATHQAP